MLPWLAAVVVLALIGLGVLFYSGRSGGGGGSKVEGAAQVAVLDADQIQASDDFKQARKDLDKLSQDLQDKLIKEVQTKKLPPEEAEALRAQYRDQLAEERAKKLRPLNERVTAAIANLASERHLRVVLDKNVVLVGAQDITADVKARFAQAKDAQMPKETGEGLSQVGYVHQDVISNLKVYKEAQARFVEESQKALQAAQKKAQGKSAAERQQLQADLQRAMMERQAEVLKPVNDKVNDAINQVAKDKGVMLVLNNSHVLWGGRNLTDDVVKRIVDKPAEK